MFTQNTCLALLLTLFACSGPREKEIQQPEPPKAHQEVKTEYSIKSSRSSEDLVQELYHELMEKYQKENMPSKAALLGYIQQQEKGKKMAGQQIQ